MVDQNSAKLEPIDQVAATNRAPACRSIAGVCNPPPFRIRAVSKFERYGGRYLGVTVNRNLYVTLLGSQHPPWPGG